MKKLICLLLALLTIIACVPVLAEQESKALAAFDAEVMNWVFTQR